MPFRFTNIPVTIQILINNILKKYLNRFYIIYLDDILIYSDSIEDYKKYVRLVLKVLQEKKLLIKLKKCEWYITRTEFLEHIVSIKKLQIQKNKIKAILKQPILKLIKNIQLFFRLTNYYRKYIKKYLLIGILFTDFIKKNVGFI